MMTDKDDRAFIEAKTREVFDTEKVPEGLTRRADYAYTSTGGRDIACDIIYRNERPDAPRPGMVFLHGGAWMFGNQKQFTRQMFRLSLDHDIFCMSVDYRLSGEAQFPAALHDAKCAVRWLRAHADEFSIDPERIAVAGGSAGGHLTAMVATTKGVPEYEGEGYNDCSSHANVAVLLNGEFDMWDLVERGSLLNAMKQFFGGTREEIPARYDEASPIQRATKDACPMLFLHGDRDECVSHEQSLAMHARLQELGVPSEIEIYEGKPHAWFNNEPDCWDVLERIKRFLEEHFRL